MTEEEAMKKLSTDELYQLQSSLFAELKTLQEFRVGSLFHRNRKCGKPQCACADKKHPGHGCWVIGKVSRGKHLMTTVPESQVPEARKLLEVGKRFWDICYRLADVTDELTRRNLTEAAEETLPVKKNTLAGILRQEASAEIVSFTGI
jgi:hypothetical protein